jgi:hypothetical protein
MNTREQLPEKEYVRQLISAAIDGELTEQKKQELDALLRRYPDVADEYSEYKKIKEVTMGIKFTEPSPDVWESYWMKVYNRLERRLGWILLSLGATVLLIFGAFEIVKEIIGDAEMPWWVKGAVFAGAAGIVILLFSVIREKIFLHKSERYKEIIR